MPGSVPIPAIAIPHAPAAPGSDNYRRRIEGLDSPSAQQPESAGVALPVKPFKKSWQVPAAAVAAGSSCSVSYQSRFYYYTS